MCPVLSSSSVNKMTGIRWLKQDTLQKIIFRISNIDYIGGNRTIYELFSYVTEKKTT